jgi:hypothetical protein
VLPEVYRPFVIIEATQKVIYLFSIRAFNSCIKSAMTRRLECGYVFNPYHSSVANKPIARKPFTMVWYVVELEMYNYFPNEQRDPGTCGHDAP